MFSQEKKEAGSVAAGWPLAPGRRAAAEGAGRVDMLRIGDGSLKEERRPGSCKREACWRVRGPRVSLGERRSLHPTSNLSLSDA